MPCNLSCNAKFSILCILSFVLIGIESVDWTNEEGTSLVQKDGLLSWYVTINDVLYLFGGKYANGVSSGEFWIRDSDGWRLLGNRTDGAYNNPLIPDPQNWPVPRHDAATWVQSTGELILFGGQSCQGELATDCYLLNDMWEYSSNNSQWTWLGGRNNASRFDPPIPSIPSFWTSSNGATQPWPGNRCNGSTWVNDDGALMLFGGFGSMKTENGGLAELWSFENGGWTFLGGNATTWQSDVIPSPPSQLGWPAARGKATAWQYGPISFLYGGYLYSNQRHDSALWLYDRGWLYLGNGTQEVHPLPRIQAATWITSEYLYLFSGMTEDGLVSDLWQFDHRGLRWRMLDQRGTVPLSTSGIAWIDSSQQAHLVSADGLYSFATNASQWLPSPCPEIDLDYTLCTSPSTLLYPQTFSLIQDLFIPASIESITFLGTFILKRGRLILEVIADTVSTVKQPILYTQGFGSLGGQIILRVNANVSLGSYNLTLITHPAVHYDRDLVSDQTLISAVEDDSNQKRGSTCSRHLNASTLSQPTQYGANLQVLPALCGDALVSQEASPQSLSLILALSLGIPLVIVGVASFLVAAVFGKKVVQRGSLTESLQNVHRGLEIGSGHFGQVFEGSWNGCCVALKRVKEEEGWQAEMSILVSVKHAHVVQYFGVTSIDDQAYLVLEYMKEGSVSQYLLGRESLSYLDMLHMSKQCAWGMKYLHEKNILHRDIALRNVLIGGTPGNYLVKLSDFGLSRLLSKDVHVAHQDSIPVRWSCPESLTEGVYTKASDVWAFGVLLWEMLTLGDNPFSNMSNRQCYHYLVAGGRLELPCEQLSIAPLMDKCWNDDRRDRPLFPEIAETLQALEVEESKNGSPHLLRPSLHRSPSSAYLHPPNLIVHPYEMPPVPSLPGHDGSPAS